MKLRTISLKDKKGSPGDVIVIIVSLLVTAIFLFVFRHFTETVGGALQNTILNSTPEGASFISDFTNVGANYSGGIFLTLFFAFALGTIITSFFVTSHPVVLPVYIICLILTVGIAAVLGNVWGTLTDVAPFSTYSTSELIIDGFMRHIVLVALIIGALSMVVIFAKQPGGIQ